MRPNKNFQRQGYCQVKLPKSLRRYLPFIEQYLLFREKNHGGRVLGSDVAREAFHGYGDPALETLLLQVLPVMQAHTGLELDPTYSFFRVYRNGHDLEIHTDRPACEISATLCVAHNLEHDWPIFMSGKAVSLRPGEMVIYRGCDIPHCREPLQPHSIYDHWQIQVFLHYVDRRGPYRDHRLDRRARLGSPAVDDSSPKADFQYQ